MVAAARLILLFAVFGAAHPAMAEDPLFPQDPQAAAPLKVTLQLPLSAVMKLKPGEDDGLAGHFILADGVPLPLNVRPRGISRLENCSFPPLWLNFKKKALKGTVLDGQNKLKLVTHCSRTMARREYLATEMLIYRLLNLLTEYSYRVRALEVTYVDTERDHEETRFGFVIEHKKRLAKRLGAEAVEVTGLAVSELDGPYAELIALFNFMVGNTDFSLLRGPAGECCHNAVPFSINGVVWPIPYDFDATGLVNPPYAAPSPALSIRRVTQRLYRGYCVHNELLPESIALFNARKAELLALVENFDDIPGVRAKRAVDYLSDFYDVINSERKVNSKLLKRCR